METIPRKDRPRCRMPSPGVPARRMSAPSGSGVLDLSHPDDAAYARSVRLLQRDSRERRWTTLGWTAVVLLMSGFILQADAFGNAPPWLADIGWLMMAVAGVALTATLTAHGVGLLRSVPETLQARRMRAAERRRALDDPALKESARDLSRARVLRAAALGGFVALTLVSGGSLHELDTGVHDLRGTGMPPRPFSRPSPLWAQWSSSHRL